MKTRHFQVLTIGLLIILFSGSCGQSQYPGYKVTDNGLYYNMIVTNDEGKGSNVGDILTMSIVLMNENDSIIYDSRENKRVSKITLAKKEFEGDIMEGFHMMSVGDSASFIASAASFFTRSVRSEVPSFIKAGSNLKFNVKMLKIQSPEELGEEMRIKEEKRMAETEELIAADKKQMENYLEKNGIDVAPTESGLYFIEIEKGTGLQAEAGNTIRIHYTGMLLDGSVFSTTSEGNPLEFSLGSLTVIPGINEAVGRMKVGGKVKLIIPSFIAYADRPPKGTIIKKFNSLVMEIELVKVMK